MNFPTHEFDEGAPLPFMTDFKQNTLSLTQSAQFIPQQVPIVKPIIVSQGLPNLPAIPTLPQEKNTIDQALFPQGQSDSCNLQFLHYNPDYVITHNGKQYIDVQYVANNKHEAFAMCDRIVSKAKIAQLENKPLAFNSTQLFQQGNQPTELNLNHSNSFSTSLDIGRRVRKENAYRWTPERHLRFAIICLALGIKDCKPKHILQFYNSEEIDRAVISSHLQKLRNSIIKQYKLSTLDSVTNDLVPKELEQNTVIQDVCRRWLDPSFSGYGRSDIVQLLRMLQQQQQ